MLIEAGFGYVTDRTSDVMHYKLETSTKIMSELAYLPYLNSA